jgi:cyclopropane fatty-acyl-phospholipid synthase-like methyltransferase
MQTNWTVYYQKKSILPQFSRKITCNQIIKCLAKFIPKDKSLKVLELGGGNSCIAEFFCKTFNITNYHVIDNNDKGIRLFLKCNQQLNVDIQAFNEDVLTDNSHEEYDVSFSIGLIEHFKEDDLMSVVQKHFRYTKKGGIVLFAFPTGTFLYKFVRYFAELFKIWQFPDEMPLKFEKVHAIANKFGFIQYKYINWWILLTQRVCVYIKK